MKRQRNPFLVTVCMTMMVCTPVFACLWDFDTLAMERQEFPDALELITGKFLRHSPELYQWRVEDRQQRLQNAPSPELYDDLAVACDKLGDSEKAIATMLEKQTRFPDLYETHANLGTFYIHSGQLEAGVEQIDVAIAINPDAHFGREVYQKLLVSYVLSRQTNNTTVLPLDDIDRSEMALHGFAEYVMESQGIGRDEKLRDVELRKALKGVLGMMRFGNHDSPILLEALGDLLIQDRDSSGAKRLAARAYLKAAYEVNDEAVQQAYRELAKASLSMQTVHTHTNEELSLESLEQTFSSELAQASQWYMAVAADEKRLVSQGGNVDEAIALRYYEEPQLRSPGQFSPWPWRLVIGGAVLITLSAATILLRRFFASRTSTVV